MDYCNFCGVELLGDYCYCCGMGSGELPPEPGTDEKSGPCLIKLTVEKGESSYTEEDLLSDYTNVREIRHRENARDGGGDEYAERELARIRNKQFQDMARKIVYA